MNLQLQREASRAGATLGTLTLDDGGPSFHTLEDEIREVASRPVREWKVAGRTAIPAGRYRVAMRRSPRFGCVTPVLVDVDGFEFILIHWGNFARNTEGCVLVGLDRELRMEREPAIYQSREAFNRLMQRLLEHQGDIWIEVKNP